MRTHPSFAIGHRRVGYAHEPLVIAEIGINHGGSLAVAREMVDAAAEAGAEIIKHQTHIVEDEMSDEARSVIPGNASESIYDIMERCALNEAEERALKEYVEDRGMLFISTPFSRAAARRLASWDVPAYKIGSGEANNLPLVEEIASYGKPVIMSTGMSDLTSVRPAVEIFRRRDVPFALLHCTNLYPTPPHLVRLEAVRELAEAYPDAVVGLSDHTVDNLACLGAVALGAGLLERHFTDHKGREGPDIVCSMDKAELFQLIQASRILALERGGRKSRLDEEQVTRDFAYASVVALRDVAPGEALSRENIWVRRPGTGDFPAREYETLLGRRVRRAVRKGAQLAREDVAPEQDVSSLAPPARSAGP